MALGIQTKQALEVYLPIRPGAEVKIKSIDRQLCKTFVKVINRAVYSNGFLYLTFTTKNSIYTDVPIRAVKQPSFYDGQCIAAGEFCMTTNGTFITIGEIEEVNERGIAIREAGSKASMFGEIRLG